MKARAFWLVVTLACLAGLFLTGRSDWALLRGDTVFAQGTVAGVAADPRGRVDRWFAIYHVPGEDGQLIQVRDRSAGSGRPPQLDESVNLVFPRGHPEQARPLALGKRALAYLVMLGFLLVALYALVTGSRAREGAVSQE